MRGFSRNQNALLFFTVRLLVKTFMEGISTQVTENDVLRTIVPASAERHIHTRDKDYQPNDTQVFSTGFTESCITIKVQS
jgi:hypothetical protein